MRKITSFRFLAFCILLTILVYARGLGGDFIFDDIPQIVLNKALFPLETYEDLVRIWHSGNTGPSGRPIAVLSFAIQVNSTGLDPFYFKLVNLIIHLFNGVLVFLLGRNIVTCLQDKQQFSESYIKCFPLLLAAWWLLSPMGLSTVLYVVQRMTLLSAMFSLLGLLWYLYFRKKDDGPSLFTGVVGLIGFAFLSILSKEIGLLTPVYAYLVEFTVYRWRSNSAVCARVLRLIKFLPVIAFVLAGIWLWKFYNFEQAYSVRSFSLSERLLTEARVLWFYIYQLFVPNVSLLTFYHDDFVISRSLLNPPVTFFALIGHAFLILLAAWLINSARLVSFGILWFYGGHLLESTIFPLELIFEHRNYLPMLGPYAAALSLPFYVENLGRNIKNFIAVALLLIGGSAFATATRAADWGSPFRVMVEAEHKPNSARANFDAGAKLLDHLRNNSTDIDAVRQCKRFLERAIVADPAHLAAFAGLIELAILTNSPIDEQVLREFESRLATAKIHPAIAFTLAHLDRLARSQSPYFDDFAAMRLYEKVISNTTLDDESRAHVLTAYGRSWGRVGNLEKKRDMLRSALNASPKMFEIHLLYIESLIEVGDVDKARDALLRLQAIDKYGYYKAEIQQIHDIFREFNQESSSVERPHN